jgi:hypothetical protein
MQSLHLSIECKSCKYLPAPVASTRSAAMESLRNIVLGFDRSRVVAVAGGKMCWVRRRCWDECPKDLVDAAGCFVLLLNYILQLPYVLAKTPQMIGALHEKDVHVQRCMLCLENTLQKHRSLKASLNCALWSLILIAMCWFDSYWGLGTLGSREM